MTVQLDIRLKRANKLYFEGESLTGLVCIDCPSELKHDGILLTMEGLVNLQMSSKSVGVLDAFYNAIKPIQLMHSVVEIAPPGRMPRSCAEIPFEIPVKARPNKTLYETYHGVFINIQYSLKCEIKRNIFSKDSVKVLEFIVQTKKSDNIRQEPVQFRISPDSVVLPKDGPTDGLVKSIPRFLVTGVLNSTKCDVAKPFTGDIMLEFSEIGIKSLELQLVRVETCGCAEGYSRDATEIQNIQIGEGDVAHGLAIPIYMIFPRLFTCPSLITSNFKLEFEINIVVIFEDDHLITENFPITLVR